MPAGPSCHMPLTETPATWIDGRVAKGGHASTSDLSHTIIWTLRIQDGGKVAVRSTVSAPAPRNKGQA